MAESVSFLVEKLAMLVQKEVKALKGVRGEFELIRDEFERMKAFLESAESSQEDNRQLKVWVNQVREVAYDTEDILDEFMIKLVKDHGHGFMGYFRKMKSSIQNLKARHRISSEIADIKSRVNSIAEGHRRYDFTDQSAISSTRGNSWHDLREDACLVDEGELVGIDEPREELVKWLVDEEPGLQVLSIFGMGGLGKTTLAKRVFDNQQVKAYFQSHAWVTVSQSYEIENILRDMIKQLHEEIGQPAPQGMESANSMRLKQIVKGFLQQKRYVIVLDDVWNSGALEGIKNAMPNSSFCSRIIITTRMADVVAVSFNQSEVYELKHLSPEESWLLFCKKSFCGNPCPPHLEHLALQILKKCEGLPLAIVAIGGLLFGKDVREWEMIYRRLAAELESNDRMQNIRKILSLSYNDLRCNLKSCFLYLAVFPEDHVIACKRLIRLWIAEGFVEKKEGMTREEVAERYLKELINRSLVQIAETTIDGRLKSCRVHDLMRECILLKVRDEKFVSFASEQQKVVLHDRVRRLSIQSASDNTLKQLNFPSLRSLLIFEPGTSSSFDEQFVPSGCRLLRVLDLGVSPLHEFPQRILVMLHLKYLSLRWTKVRIIPRSIGKLQNLETLDLKQTLVSELPVEITKLIKLQHLFVYSYVQMTIAPFPFVRGFTAPQGIGALASLQKLSCVKAGSGQSKNTMQELGALSQLTRLGVTDLKADDTKELCRSVEKMTHLQSLYVTVESECEFIDLDFLSSPPPLLQGLYVKGCLKKLPRWLPLLSNLARVHLKHSRLKLSPLFALQNLPNLMELNLVNAFDGEKLDFGDRAFPKLKKLGLAEMENLRFVSINGQAMPCLQSLIIYKCRQLDWQSLLIVIRGLTLLTYLKFCEMPEEFALAFYPHSSSKMMREGILQECYEEVMERNPEVYFFWSNQDHWERYDLSFYCYNVIKRRVTSSTEGSEDSSS